MIKLHISQPPYELPRIVYIDEETLSVDHYDEGTPLEQLNQMILLIQKAIDSIYDMTFINHIVAVYGENEYVNIHIFRNIDIFKNNEDRFVEIMPNHIESPVYWYNMSYDEFKKLLMAQHKENELTYLLLKGFIE